MLMKCEHCRLDYEQTQMIAYSDKFFCCKGCQNVWEILHENKLDEFYKKLGNQTLSPVNFENDIKSYDEFIIKTKEGFSEIYLMIHGIECAACIWLNERILAKQEGILELDMNHVNHKVHIVFDEHSISLMQILRLIESIGYKASAYDPSKASKKADLLKRKFYAKLVVAIACVMNIMWIAVAKYAGFFTGMDKDTKDVLNFAEFILCSPVLFYTGSHFYQSAFKTLKMRSLSMDVLVISGASLAYIYSLWAMFFRVGEVYFDSVAMIICFVFIGKYLEMFSKKRALDTVDGLNDFLQNEVLVFNGEEFVPKQVQKVCIGDMILLKTGDKVLIDGICKSGEISIDTSSLNGENIPKLIQKNDEIFSASIVLDGSAQYEATKLYKDSKLSKIIQLLELASSKKAKLESLVNNLSAYFSRTVLFLAFICFSFFLFYKKMDFEIALVNAISVLIIACPCALALATPVSNLVALGRALKKHILFKSSSVIEDLSKCNCVVFDKTGILTKLELELKEVFLDKELNLDELYNFVKLSKHPISQNIALYLKKIGARELNFDFKKLMNIQAKGLSAFLDGKLFLGGNTQFLKENHIFVKDFEGTHFIFAKEGKVLAFFEFDNVLREGAKELIAYLKKQKKELMILSGDNQKAVEKIAQELQISNFKASCLPEDKMTMIEKLSKKYKVLFIGDGVNDALALKYSSVSITLREGSDLAIESSDVLLLKNDLFSLEKAIRLSKNTFKIIKQNLAFSLVYNACTIPLAFFGMINPLFAAISMSFSSIIVILNTLRIKE
ncbi:heavy metal translocating P-type ATPase [Campylobacter hepaticus]|uniref:Copper-transporting ATPase n=1 Tax=Campylobacter hepaticus TaxID=1813019 RepID=A0A6A7JTM5_9BACT|nr:heavy metal translocating P-type ATPase [Campylobacter hepaticus]AXP08360.1 heavy metal translocating P-type ATPase [Campylobacter hepaticus]MCZ0772185.1 heavy metal translocating P-type ATPase [Campylobacter hepaticus]MCZ0773654.1 heavy metal translocating P-type ATPase [Campylobacter hepaticus]MCZ0774904.1 heavy metal translocating P-type ATPase [Campylobacter hepaticus]MDX2322785.1 heavy metal translocating P-type ATPase metal-binding domain-containing protein [Campylobacter hepaticus]